VAAIAATLAAMAQRLNCNRDHRAVFTTAYQLLSEELAAALQTKRFSDPIWVADLAQAFAKYYLDANVAYESGTLTPGAWRTVFSALEAGKTSVLEELLLGMTAHIVRDLPYALCDVGTQYADGSSRVGDFHEMNDVLGDAIEKIQRQIARCYDGSLGVLDRIVESYDELLTNYGLRVSRAAGWYNAERLRDPASRAATVDALERSPEITLTRLLDPPVWSLRLLARGARVASSLARRWPA
jgi:hypothetical protein